MQRRVRYRAGQLLISSGTIAIGDNVDGEYVVTQSISQSDFRAAVAQYLPDTPKFIVDLFAQLAENLVQ